MSYLNLIKTLKLLNFRILQYRHIQSHVSSVSFSYLYSFSQNLKSFSRINKCTYVPSVNIHTSNRYFDSSEEEEDLSRPLVKLTFIKSDGEEVQVEGRAGLSVMTAALKNDIPMEAACGGQLGCTTCHVYVENGTEKYFEKPVEEEEDMIDRASFQKPNSRLCCQLIITEDFKNARFRLPKGTTNFAVDGKILQHS